MSIEITNSNLGVTVGEDIIEAAYAYEALRYNDYSVENGLGEIIDNSVDAKTREIKIDFERRIKKVGKKQIEEIKKIFIADNGAGMSEAILARCLVLGYSMKNRTNGRLGIGKFGVGMTLGGLSIAKRIEVYSRDDEDIDFKFTYIDLDEIKDGKITISAPVKKEIPEEYKEFYDGYTGTLVILSNCDRMDGTGRRVDPNELNGILANYLGRTYRKFIEGGLRIYINGRFVYLHDPLYVVGPTLFDTKESQDPKAELCSEHLIDWEIPGKPGEKATIRIKISLLPLAWRTNIGNDGNVIAKKRKIDQNVGVSILRANREVFYGKIPYLIGMKRGQFSYQDNDKWWGCEISFPPELDDCFQIRCIKRGAEPIEALKNRIRAELTGEITSLRKRIKEDSIYERVKHNKTNAYFENVVEIMNDVDDLLSKNQIEKNMTKEEEEVKIERILDEIAGSVKEETDLRDARKKSIYNNKYSIFTIKRSMPTLFEMEQLLGDKMVIMLNINHPYYQKVIEPLYGECFKANLPDELIDKTNVRDAIILLLVSYLKAKAMMEKTENNRVLFRKLEEQWGAILSVTSDKLAAVEM